MFSTILNSRSTWLSMILVLAAFCLPVYSQITATTTEPVLDGNTVVVVYSTDGIGNTVATQTISTLGGAPVVTPTLTTTTVPVTVTNPLGPAPPTTYAYTTVDAAGNTQVITDVFTPTYMPAVSSFSRQTGTVWDYADYISMYGPHSITNGSQRSRSAFPSGFMWAGLVSVVGVLFGVGAVGLW